MISSTTIPLSVLLCFPAYEKKMGPHLICDLRYDPLIRYDWHATIDDKDASPKSRTSSRESHLTNSQSGFLEDLK